MKLRVRISPDVCFGIAATLLLLAVWNGKPFGNYTRLGALLLIPAVLCCAAGIFMPSAETYTPKENHRGLLWALVCTAMLYHLITILSMIRAQGGATIDVYLFQHHSAGALLRGVDPYTLTTENMYGPSTKFYEPQMIVNGRVQIGYPYPPASLFFVLPAYFFGDIRYSYIAAILLSAGFLTTFRTTLISAAAACLLLLSPVTLYVELQSWTDPFLLFALTCTLYAALKQRWWLPLALGVFVASKQYGIFALPFAPLLLGERSWKAIRKLLLETVVIAAALTLPMALWNTRGFWHDVVLVHIRQPFRIDALTLSNLFFPVPFAAILIIVVIAITFAMRTARPHPSMFAACYAFTLLVFVCANKQAFCNYYFLVAHALFLAVATLAIPISAKRSHLEQRLASFSVEGLEPADLNLRR